LILPVLYRKQTKDAIPLPFFAEKYLPLRPFREKANRENPQIFPIGKYK
jgi:hypothetical protein